MNIDTLHHTTTLSDNNNNNLQAYDTNHPSSKNTIHTSQDTPHISNIPQNNELLSREMKRETEEVTEEVTEEEINIVVKKKSSKLIRKEDFVIPTYKTRKDLLEKN